ncbi:MAG: nicotinamide-nucleotide amidohydrolase family protein [Methylophaga sp.]|nr:nicotinamide-nucleotide amidohydrolase family protein [Methylophaga sp.]
MQNISDAELQQLTIQIAKHLLDRNLSLSVAESCTGGWVAKCCTDLAGSSAWFDRGVVSYSNQSKQDLLNVQASTLTKFGAVSEQTALEMAQGCLSLSNADISVSITGIAGPDGGSLEKPVGTAWIAWALKGSAKAELHHFSGNRDAIRRQAVSTALNGIIKNASD